MKSLLFLALLGAARIAAAGDVFPVLKTVNAAGTVLELRDVRVVRVEADGIRVMHSSGTAKVPYERLPEDLRLKYGIDASKADQHRAEANSKAAAPAPVIATNAPTTAAVASAPTAASAPDPLLNSDRPFTKEDIKQMWLGECQGTFICPSDPQCAAKQKAVAERVAMIRSGAYDGTAEQYAQRANARKTATAPK